MRKTLVTLFIIVSSAVISSAQSNTGIRLRGAAATEQLKQRGQYNSLLEAFRKARDTSGQSVGNPTPEATGQTAKLIAPSGGPNDNFGASLAIQGDHAVISAKDENVGANDSQGAVYVFVLNGTSWLLEQRLTASDGAAFDRFGFSVLINGNSIVVGAPFDDIGTNTDQGSAYYFVKSGATWIQIQKLVAADGIANAFFGYSVASSGFSLVVGANQDRVNGNIRQGSIYVYTGAGAWSLQEKITAFDGSTDDRFGGSVAIDGNILIAGSHFDNIDANADQGSAYVYIRNGTSWMPFVKLLAPDGVAGDHFGVSVGISGNTAVVGSYFDDIGTNSNQGSVYVFLVSTSSWSFQRKLTAADGANGDVFGSSVGIDGDVIVVGAPHHNIGTSAQQGSAYVFTRTGTLWSQRARLVAADGASSDRFGDSVAVSGEFTLVGSTFDTIGANADQGSAYVFHLLYPVWSQEAHAVAPGGDLGEGFGVSVSLSGDTAVIGAPNHRVGTNNSQGAAYVFVRSGTTWLLQGELIASDGAGNDSFGISVSVYGDIVAIGASTADIGGKSNQGVTYIFVRNGTAWSEYRKLVASDGAAHDNFGHSVAINEETVIIGAPNVVGGNGNQGAAYVFFKVEADWVPQAKLIYEFGGSSDNFGNSVAINEDTAIVGAYHHDVGGDADQGSAYVFTRNGTLWSQPMELTVADGSAQDNFGHSVALHDRTAVVGAPNNDIGANGNQGSVYVFVKIGSGWEQQQKLVALDGAGNDFFGSSVAIDGDIAIIGSFQDDIGDKIDQGSAYVWERTGVTWNQKQKLAAIGGAAADIFGFSVGISGDKILVGAPFADILGVGIRTDNSTDEGSSLVPGVVDQGAAYFFINTPTTPTAANVSISGRVLTPSGSGLSGATVYITNQLGEIRTVRSSSFGYYRFEDVEVGQIVSVSVLSKRYQFIPHIVSVSGDLTELNLFGVP